MGERPEPYIIVSEDGNTWHDNQPEAKVFYTSQGAQNATEAAKARLAELIKNPNSDPEEISTLKIQIRRLELEKQLAEIVNR